MSGASASRRGQARHERRVLEPRRCRPGRSATTAASTLTGPSQRYRSLSVELELRRAGTARASPGTPAATSSRTGAPNWRCGSSPCKRLAQVLHLLLVDPQVGVARHAELRVADDLAPREQIAPGARGSTDDSRKNASSSPLTSAGSLITRGTHARRLDDRDRRCRGRTRRGPTARR